MKNVLDGPETCKVESLRLQTAGLGKGKSSGVTGLRLTELSFRTQVQI